MSIYSSIYHAKLDLMAKQKKIMSEWYKNVEIDLLSIGVQIKRIKCNIDYSN